MKKLLFLPAALLLLACSNVHTEGEKNITEGGDTIAHEDISLSKLDAVEELSKEEPEARKASPVIFKAQGSEPGWFAEFTEHHLRFVFDYGKDSLHLDHEFKGLGAQNGYAMNDDKLQLKIDIQHSEKPLTTDKGDAAYDKVIINYHDKQYKGTGGALK